MPSTRFYLLFWSVVILLSGLAAAFFYRNILFCLVAIASIALINGIAWANFKLHRKPLHNLLLEVLE